METKTDILIIEDDQFMRDLIALSLRDVGYRVVECSGQRTQRVPEPVQPKVVIVDLIEPKRSSIETIGTLRTRFPAASILAISGYFRVGPAMADAAIRQLGVDQALAKPFSCSELVSSVKTLLDRQTQD